MATEKLYFREVWAYKCICFKAKIAHSNRKSEQVCSQPSTPTNHHHHLHYLQTTTTTTNDKQTWLPWQWIVQWNGSREDGLGWHWRQGWSAGCSCCCWHTQRDSTWGSEHRATGGRTIPCKTHITIFFSIFPFFLHTAHSADTLPLYNQDSLLKKQHTETRYITQF